MLDATLRLFNAVAVSDYEVEHSTTVDQLSWMLKRGFVIDPRIVPRRNIMEAIDKIVGFSGERANATLHKSWEKVRDASIEQLVVEQIAHYITTYGYERFGIFDHDTVYIPDEALNFPDVDLGQIELTVVRAITDSELKDAVCKLSNSGIALHEETLNDMMTIVKYTDWDTIWMKDVGNRELLTRLYDYYGIAPSDPTEYLRWLIHKLTDQTLLIKSRGLIEQLKMTPAKDIDPLLEKAPKNLGTIFNRYKPLFLAMKHASNNKRFFNRLRKKAVYQHIPLPVDYMNDVTRKIKHNIPISVGAFKDMLNKASIFRKTRLAYALKYRLEGPKSIVYRVRNGKGFATDFGWDKQHNDTVKDALDITLESIANDMKPQVEGKTYYIPDNVHYALPATEKQFTGQFPTGTYVTVPRDIIFGIHWENVGVDKEDDGWGGYKGRIDLDLSVIDIDGKTGWDAAYRSDGCLFSGDITDAPAPNGATEVFHVKEGTNPKILYVNYFNYDEDLPVPAKIVVAHDDNPGFSDRYSRSRRDYVLDINNIIAAANVTIDKKSNILGIIFTKDDVTRFGFTNVAIGNAITSYGNAQSTQAREYLVNQFTDPVELRDVLISARANVVSEIPEDSEYIDLSPENLDKTSIIGLMTP